MLYRVSRKNSPPNPPAKPKNKGGRPKGPCSERELEQRRGAGWKHGGRASTLTRSSLPPCKESVCPLSYPCDVRRQADAADKALDHCPVAAAIDPSVRDAYRAAIIDGDHKALRELAATALANQQLIFQRGQEQLLRDGLTVEEDVIGKDGTSMGTRQRAHAAAGSVLTLAAQLGWTAEAHQLTPKSADEGKRDRGLGGLADHLVELNKRAALPVTG